MSPVAEYEVFEYKEADEPVLSLTEATEKAARLRGENSANAYRVVPANEEHTNFRVVCVPMHKVYGEIWARLYEHFAPYLFAPRLRR
jgi:hypothetical protein